MTSFPRFRLRHPSAGAALIIAAGLLAASVAPSVAATWPQQQGFAAEGSPTTTSFHRHFWRGSQMSASPAPASEMVALADDAEAMHAYCSDRFRSYDPETGTYLGYDGYEHSCP